MNLSRYRYPPPPCVEPTYDQGYTPVYTQPLTLPNNAHAVCCYIDTYKVTGIKITKSSNYSTINKYIRHTVNPRS